MNLTKLEKETIICFNEQEDTATVYTFNKDLKRRLARFSNRFSEQCKRLRSEYGADTYEIEKTRLSIRLIAPYSEARRKAQSERAKKTGFQPSE